MLPHLRTITIAVCLMVTSSVHAGQVVLTSRNVVSAIDIEHAIRVATASGHEPGVVILDGRDGPFTYTGSDRSINIEFSNFELRGVKNATITNSGGLFLGAFDLENIEIRDITFQSVDNAPVGIQDGSNIHTRTNIRIKNNIFEGELTYGGILIVNPIYCKILGNLITTESDSTVEAIALSGGHGSRVENNTFLLNSLWGIVLERGTRANQIVNNTILAKQIGVLLREGAAGNTVTANRIAILPPTLDSAGIFLDASTFKNTVLDNSVSGEESTVVNQGTENWVARNR